MQISKNQTNKIREKIMNLTPLTALIVMFLLLKFAYIGPRFSDGHVYTYMGHLITQGAMPYRDFYYSSPPFLPYVMAVLGMLTNWGGVSTDVAPIVLSALDAVLIFLICSKKTTRLLPPLIATLMYLSSYTILATTDFATDIHWIVSLFMLGWWAHTQHYFAVSRLLFACAVLVKAYAVIIVIAIALLLWLIGQRKNAVLVVTASFAVGLAVCGAFYLKIGQPFLDQVYFNNLHRMPGIQTSSILSFFISHDLWIYPAAGAFVMLFWKNFRLWPYAIPLLLYMGFILFYPDVYYLYLKPVAAYSAMLLGADVCRSNTLTKNFFYPVLGVALLSTSIISVSTYLSEQANTSKIDGIDDIVKSVEELTGRGDSIYGESSFVPIIALLANRSIFKNYVDTNIKFVNQGLFTLEDRAKEIAEAKVKIILTKAVVLNGQIQSLSPVLPVAFLTSQCMVARSFPLKVDYSENAILIWKCSY
jgi:hypothetical protein